MNETEFHRLSIIQGYIKIGPGYNSICITVKQEDPENKKKMSKFYRISRMK